MPRHGEGDATRRLRGARPRVAACLRPAPLTVPGHCVAVLCRQRPDRADGAATAAGTVLGAARGTGLATALGTGLATAPGAALGTALAAGELPPFEPIATGVAEAGGTGAGAGVDAGGDVAAAGRAEGLASAA
jgi:hypothetical protein